MARLLGLDFGTGGVRVGVFDLDQRAVVAEREAFYETRHPRLDRYRLQTRRDAAASRFALDGLPRGSRGGPDGGFAPPGHGLFRRRRRGRVARAEVHVARGSR